MRHVWLLFILFALPPLASCQQYPFLLVDGSPQTIDVIIQDRNGLLWLATDHDVEAFDGSHFYSLTSSGLPATGVTGLAEDDDGGIWIAARKGLFRYFRGHTEKILPNFISSVVRVAPNCLVAAVGPLETQETIGTLPASLNLYRVRKSANSWTTDRLADWQTTGFLTLDPSNFVIYPYKDSWAELSPQAVSTWSAGDSSAPVVHKMKGLPGRVLRDADGWLWFRSPGGAAFQRPADSDFTLWAEAGTLDDSSHMGQLPDGTVWIEGVGKILMAKKNRGRAIRSLSGLPTPQMLFEDRSGTLWLGSSKGLFRIPHSFNLEFWTGRDGLEGPLSEIHVGSNVFAASGQGVKILDKDRQHWQSIGDPSKFGLVLHLAPGPNQSIITTRFDGITQIDSTGKILADSIHDSAKYAGTMLAELPNKQLFVSGFGVRQIKILPNRIDIGEAPSITSPALLALDIDYDAQTDTLAAATSNGLAILHKGEWRLLTTKEGLLNNFGISVATFPNGDIWYGYISLGQFTRVHFSPNGEFTMQHFDSGPGIGDGGVHFLGRDQRGWLWRGSNEGVFVASEEQATSGSWFHLNAADGLPEAIAAQQSFYSDPDGSVWFALENSIAHFTPPPNFVHPPATPEIFVSGFSWNGTQNKLAQSIASIPHGSQLTAQIGSFNFEHKNELLLRYRLLPEQSDWKDSSSFDLKLGKLPWGSHQLQVQARIGKGPWSGTTSYSFWVTKPLWFTWPALLGFAVIGLVAGVGGRQWHKQREARKKTVLPELAPWRIATLLPEVQEYSGTLLDSRFEVRELIARGGFANVLAGYDRQQKRPVAIKFFRSEVGNNEWIMRRFQQEVSALQQVQHPHIVPIYAHGFTSSAIPYLVMEYVEGKSLRELLPSGPIAPARTARLLSQLAGALEAIHKKQICHRDVKPENLMIRNFEMPSEELILIDFSISLVKDANETLHGLSRAAGSFDYMAPEQAIGYAQSSSDIYSLTKVLLEMLTGQRLTTLLPGASLDTPARVRELLQTLPLQFSATSISMIASALEFDPTRRPQDVTTFAASIVRDLQNTSSKP